jgi:hypothetical protein
MLPRQPWVFKGAAALSLLICIGTIVTWVRSRNFNLESGAFGPVTTARTLGFMTVEGSFLFELVQTKPGDFFYTDNWQFFQGLVQATRPGGLPHEFAGFEWGWQSGWFAALMPPWFIATVWLLLAIYFWRRAARSIPTPPPNHMLHPHRPLDVLSAMRHPRRRLSVIAAAMCLLICAASIVVWAKGQGYYVTNPLPRGRAIRFEAAGGDFWLEAYPDTRQKFTNILNFHHEHGLTWKAVPYQIAGFGWLSRGRLFQEFVVPIWFITTVTLLLGIYFLRHATRPIPIGRCLKCGYDLRATPDRCPECGTIPPASAKPHLQSPPDDLPPAPAQKANRLAGSSI